MDDPGRGMKSPGGHRVESIAEVKSLRDGPTLSWGRRERKMHVSGGVAQSGQIHVWGAGHDEHMTAGHTAEQVEAGFMMLDELDAIARTAAAAQFTGGHERGMGEHEDSSGHRDFTFTGDDVSGIISDAGGLDARDGEEGAKHERRSLMGAMRDQAAARAGAGIPADTTEDGREAVVGLAGACARRNWCSTA